MQDVGLQVYVKIFKRTDVMYKYVPIKIIMAFSKKA